jgi:hypothetical protein
MEAMSVSKKNVRNSVYDCTVTVDVESRLATYTNLLPYVEDVEFYINSSTTVLSQFPAWTI